jgi:hypothetical protein
MPSDYSQPSGIEAQVCADIAARQQVGIQKYGQTLAENPLGLKDWLQHAYHEALDKALYLKRAMAALDALPEEIAKDLFTNGQGEACDRLVHCIDSTPKRYGAGWAQTPVINRIRALLADMPF